VTDGDGNDDGASHDDRYTMVMTMMTAMVTVMATMVTAMAT